jgi:hypothetical protein
VGHQVSVFRLPESITRQMRAFVDDSDSGYASIDEFVEAAIRNQLTLEVSSPGERGSSESRRPVADTGPLLGPVEPEAPIALATPRFAAGTLSVMTNRLSPVKIAVRVLANLTRSGHFPDVKQFQEHASRCARFVGLRLREEEIRRNAKGADRRSTAFPVANGESKALERYVAHFTTAKRGSAAPGPLEILGLAQVEEPVAKITAAGWRLAALPSPLLDECEGWTLGPEEMQMLRLQLHDSQEEAQAVRRFLRLVRRSAGGHDRLNELMILEHSTWTASLAVAHRAAMTGRLRELGLLEVDGRGSDARIRVTVSGEQWTGDAA